MCGFHNFINTTAYWQNITIFELKYHRRALVGFGPRRSSKARQEDIMRKVLTWDSLLSTHVSIRSHRDWYYCMEQGQTLYARAGVERPAQSHVRSLAPRLKMGHLT